MNNLALAKRETGSAAPVSYNQQQVQLIKDSYAKGATDEELRLFVEIAQRKGLDIFSNQICLIERWDSKLNRAVKTPQTTIDGYRLIAERTEKYEGQIGPFWCGEDGEWKDVWIGVKAPTAAKVGIWKTGAREPFIGVALYREYVQTKKDGQPNSMWSKMPANQLAKCAEALALRKAFPAELSGIYTQEEMGQASNPPTISGGVIEGEIIENSMPVEQPKPTNGNGQKRADDLCTEFWKRGRAAGIKEADLKETASLVGKDITWTEAIESLPEV